MKTNGLFTSLFPVSREMLSTQKRLKKYLLSQLLNACRAYLMCLQISARHLNRISKLDYFSLHYESVAIREGFIESVTISFLLSQLSSHTDVYTKCIQRFWSPCFLDANLRIVKIIEFGSNLKCSVQYVEMLMIEVSDLMSVSLSSRSQIQIKSNEHGKNVKVKKPALCGFVFCQAHFSSFLFLIRICEGSISISIISIRKLRLGDIKQISFKNLAIQKRI